MISVEDLLWVPWLDMTATSPEMNPLLEADALQEAQLLDLRVHALSSTVGLLFELRTALQLREGNAAVLVVQGVREFTWVAEPRPSGFTAWNIVSSEPKSDGQTFGLTLDCMPHSQLRLVAANASFYVIEVPGLGEDPPDYSGDDEVMIRTRLVSWGSSFSPIQAAHFDPSKLDR